MIFRARGAFDGTYIDWIEMDCQTKMDREDYAMVEDIENNSYAFQANDIAPLVE